MLELPTLQQSKPRNVVESALNSSLLLFASWNVLVRSRIKAKRKALDSLLLGKAILLSRLQCERHSGAKVITSGERSTQTDKYLSISVHFNRRLTRAIVIRWMARIRLINARRSLIIRLQEMVHERLNLGKKSIYIRCMAGLLYSHLNFRKTSLLNCVKGWKKLKATKMQREQIESKKRCAEAYRVLRAWATRCGTSLDIDHRISDQMRGPIRSALLRWFSATHSYKMGELIETIPHRLVNFANAKPCEVL